MPIPLRSLTGWTYLLVLSTLSLGACHDGRDPVHNDHAPAVEPEDDLADTPELQALRTRLTWQCGDSRLQTRFVQADGAALILEGGFGEKRLFPAVSASGARFSDRGAFGAPETEFWSKGEVASLIFEGDPQECVHSDGRSPWVNARESGALMRVVGHEPFWTVVINPDPSDEILVASKSVPCLDVVTGSPHPATTELTLVGASVSGCGRNHAGERAEKDAPTL